MARGSLRPPGPARRPTMLPRPADHKRHSARADPSSPPTFPGAVRGPKETIRVRLRRRCGAFALLPSPTMDIMGIRIPTLISDNVALRCDGCRDVIEGTPWRVNILDIVATETAPSWTDAPILNPGPFQFHPRPGPCPGVDAREGLPLLPSRPVREIMRPIPIPGEAKPALGPVRRPPSRRPRVHPGLTVRPLGRGATRGPATHPPSPPKRPLTASCGVHILRRSASRINT